LADWGVGTSLRRLCAPTGALVALCLVFAVSAVAAPSPDPPPAPPAPPKTEPVQPTVTVVVRQAPVVTPAPVVQQPKPVAKVPVQRAKPKPAKVKPVVKPKASAPVVARPPHDRNRVPLAAFVATPSADSVDRDLLALAGFGLLLVAMGGAVVLFAARRQLRELAL
jgi:outer membrane biosynthesis protein TonB